MVRILSFGCQREYLRRRHDALERAGFKVNSVTSCPEAERLIRAKHFDIFLVGHAVPIKERVQVSLLAKALQKIPVIYFYAGSISQAESADAVLTVDGNLEDLIFTIYRLVAHANRSSGFSQKSGS